MTIVKICGITTLEDALAAAQAGADMLGFNFYRRSPRFIEPDSARHIADALRLEFGAACPLLVGVFVNEGVSTISSILGRVGLKAAQLSGDESVEMLKELRGIAFKAIRPRSRAEAEEDIAYFMPAAPADERLPMLLLDAYHPQLYGGSGETASLEIAQSVRAAVPRFMLAGGLTPENVAERTAALQPWGVDTASGVELEGQPGRKDSEKVSAFIRAAKGN